MANIISATDTTTVIAFDRGLSTDQRNLNAVRVMRRAIAELAVSRQALDGSIAGMTGTINRLNGVKAQMTEAAEPHRRLIGMIDRVETLVATGRFGSAGELLATLAPEAAKGKLAKVA